MTDHACSARGMVLALLLAVFMIFFILPASALGGGAGPPKNFTKGVFIKVDGMAGKALFLASGTESPVTLEMGEDVTVEGISLNRKVMITLEEQDGHPVVRMVETMFLDLTFYRFLALMVVGLLGGLLSGFIGSGGAFVLTPAMMSLGVPGSVAVASNMCHKFPKAMVGAYKRFRYGQVDIKLGLTIALSAIVGVQIGIAIQKAILKIWGNAGSNLYVSVVFVIVLLVVGGYVLRDAVRLSGSGVVDRTSELALKLQKLNIPPIMNFRTAGVKISAWITLPLGLATGMLAATIAVGGFIGVPGMIYLVGASAIVASGTELLIAFVMGAWGSIQWGISGLIDIRLTLLILATSLIGVQLGALGTTYVKDYAIKLVMAAVMLIVAVSRGVKIPGYLGDLGLIPPLESALASILNSISFWSLVAALGTSGVIITSVMLKGMLKARQEDQAIQAGKA